MKIFRKNNHLNLISFGADFQMYSNQNQTAQPQMYLENVLYFSLLFSKCTWHLGSMGHIFHHLVSCSELGSAAKHIALNLFINAHCTIIVYSNTRWPVTTKDEIFSKTRQSYFSFLENFFYCWEDSKVLLGCLPESTYYKYTT